MHIKLHKEMPNVMFLWQNNDEMNGWRKTRDEKKERKKKEEEKKQ